MPLLLWVDIAARALTINICTALGLLTIGNLRKRSFHYFFGLFCITQSLSASGGLLTYVFLDFIPGNPEFFLELKALAFSLASIFLLLFAVNFTERSNQHQRSAYILAGVGELGLISGPRTSGISTI